MNSTKFSELYKQNHERFQWQQKKAIEIQKEFAINLRSKLVRDAVSMSLYKLFRFAEAFFKREEILMNKINYPDRNKHLKEHEEFIEYISKLKSKINAGKQVLPIEISIFIKNWINKHIEKKDAQVYIFLKSLTDISNSNIEKVNKSKVRKAEEKQTNIQKNRFNRFSRYYHFSHN